MPVFDPQHLDHAVNQFLTDTDTQGAQNAFVTIVTRDANGAVIVQAVVSQKIGDTWSVKALGQIDHEKHISGGIECKAVW